LATDKIARHINGPLGYAARIAICTILLISTALAKETTNEALSNEKSPETALKWTEVEKSKTAEILQMLADKTRVNYEKIQTWEGTYLVHSKEYLAKENVASAFGENFKNKNDIASLIRNMQCSMPFVIDIASESIYRSKEDSVFKWKVASSGKQIKIPNTSPVQDRSIVTPEHYLSFDPKIVWPGFSEIINDPEAQNKRTAFRDSPVETSRQHYGDLMDPRNFFGFGNSSQKSWDIPQTDLQALKGEYGEEAKKLANETITIFQSNGPGGVWYRLFTLLDNSRTHLNIVWSPEAGYNTVSYDVINKGVVDEKPRSKISWRWKKIDGVYIPVWMKEFLYRRDTGEMTLSREVELKDCRVNKPIDPAQFTYAGLGMKDGELVKDKINKAFYTIKDGKPVKLGNFGKKYIPPEERTSLTRWLIIAVGALLFVGGTAHSIARRKKNTDS
jgi:hypothetical protein